MGLGSMHLEASWALSFAVSTLLLLSFNSHRPKLLVSATRPAWHDQFKTTKNSDNDGRNYNMSTHFCQLPGFACGRGQHQRVITKLSYTGSTISSNKVHAASMGSGNDTDYQALMEFKAKINNQHGVMTWWNNTIHFCKWYGVTCNYRQRVTKLELRSLQLIGALSPFIGNLSFLTILNLENNSFSHAIPQEIGRLHMLHELRLNNNSFVDQLPLNISHCSKLKVLHVGVNLLGGEIPGVLGQLSHLKRLNLYRNNFIGSIPPSLGNLSALKAIALDQNRLSGGIPETLGQLKNLKYFSLAMNGISGIIPASIFNLSNIRILYIAHNYLHGNLPSDIGITMPHVKVFSIGNNQFTGLIPVSISNASNLFALETQNNSFIGTLPSFEKLKKLSRLSLYLNHLGSGRAIGDMNFLCSLTNSTSLQHVEIGNNNFGGPLPECISNLSSVSKLNIQNNEIFGRIPDGIENLINLEVIAASSNQLSGSIPNGVGRLQNLKAFYAASNSLSGAIPTSFGNLTMLVILALRRNNLQGNIPSELGMCENLVELSLASNNLTGSIPAEVIGLSSLSTILDLSSNHLTGVIPVEVENLRNLVVLDVSSNNLSGMLPNNLGSCVLLEKLYLRGNFFEGLIPSSWSSLRGLEELDISRNKITGEIPHFLVRFEFLQYLNLSFNDLEGALPTEGVFKNASATFIQGNKKLCGGVPIFHLPKCHLKSSTNTLKLKLAITFAILGVTLVFSILLLLRFIRKKRGKPIEATCEEISLLKLSYQSILKATNGFSSENLVGSGSFGSVYKGIIVESGIVIAVKVLNLLNHGASKSFMAECEALKNIRHRNLVKILTAISSVDYQGNDFKALVYEFMEKGSLEDWLHPSFGMEHLTLIQRVNIAAHVASALEYLHHHCETPIIHCDLKPSNILLDDGMVAHVGDFGLSKFLATETPNNMINQLSSIGFRGTIGYAPPEYGLGCEVSTKGDVYSYGILLLEMFTGKKPTDEPFKEGLSLHNFVKAELPEQLDKIIDPILLIGREKLDKRNLQYLNSIFEIGLTCSAESPNERMEMSVVAAKLYSIRDKLLIHPTRVHH